VPIYEHICNKCKKLYEVISSWEDRGKQKCPDCGKKTEFVISTPGHYEIKGKNNASSPSKNAKKFKD
jgi:putative FmdB family regulatory protein